MGTQARDQRLDTFVGLMVSYCFLTLLVQLYDIMQKCLEKQRQELANQGIEGNPFRNP
jgi:hypothetical protein